MSVPHTVFDADGHICEPELIWTEYTQEKYRKKVLQVRTANGASGVAVEDNCRIGAPGTGPIYTCLPGGMSDDRNLVWEDMLPGSHDPNERLKVIEEEGMNMALFFPSIHLLWGDIDDPEIAAETCRAYNNWMSDFCKTSPDRLFGMGIIPLQDVDLAIAEAKRLASIGLRGILVRPERFNGLPLYDASLDPLWEVAVSDNLAVGVHGSFGSKMKGFHTGRYEGNTFLNHMIAHPFGQMASMMDFICGGVLERHRNLRVGFFESGLGWAPYWLGRMDEHKETLGKHTPWLKRLPSEIFREQCYVSMEADEEDGLAWMREMGMLDNVLWGSDYPHYDSTYPGAYRDAQATFDKVGEDVASKVVLENPKRFIRL